MTARSREAARGLAALVALVLLLAGPPLALAHFVGWPLPTALPTFDEMATATRGGLDDMFVVKVLAVLAWIVWAQLALAALTEIAAVIRGRAPRRAPVLPAIQVSVAKLVAIAALVAAGTTTQRADPTPITRLVSAVSEPTPHFSIPAPPEHEPVTRHRDETPVTPTRPQQTYQVRKHDSWWGIAERLLGDGERWRELRGQNVGRLMSDGSVVEPTSETIHPGWQLVLPVDATQESASIVGEPGAEVTVRRGDTMWDIAKRHLRDATGAPVGDSQVRDYWVELVEANRDRLADRDNPNLIYTGQALQLPAVNGHPARPAPPGPAAPSVPDAASAQLPESSSSTTTPVTEDNAPAGPTTSSTTRPAPPESDGEELRADQRERAPVGMLGAASTLLAVGISGAVWRRRRRRQVQIPAGHKPPDPPAALDELRTELAAASDVDHAARLRLAMHDIAASLADRRSDARVRLVQASGQRIEALLSQPVLPAPSGWKAEASGSAWVLDGEPRGPAGDLACATPALVSIGRPDEGTELYLDLEAEAVIALLGDADSVTDVARSWLVELATSPLCAGVSIALVGDGPLPVPEESDRVRAATSWEGVAADVESWVEQSSALLQANRWATPPIGRVRGRRSDDLAPLVLFVAERPDDSRFDELCRVISERQVAVTVIVLGQEVDGATVVEVRDGELGIPNLGLVCHAQSVTSAAAEQVDALLADADELPAQLELIPPPAPRPPLTIGSPTDLYEDPPYEVLVRLLGEICVIGGTKKLKPKQTAVVAYIALHAPAPSDRVEDALWVAPTASRHKRLANTVSETRTALGAAHLPAATDGRYRVGPMVITDLELFDRRVAYAAQQEDKLAIDTLRGALELVEGTVFSYRNAERLSYVWVDVENWHSTWELKVVNAAEDLAQRCLAIGDLDGAIWAAQRGLAACQMEPRLTKPLIRAHLGKGDRSAARQVFESYQAALEGLDLDEPAPDLIELYEEARGGRATAAG